jgi:hypothetical protein
MPARMVAWVSCFTNNKPQRPSNGPTVVRGSTMRRRCDRHSSAAGPPAWVTNEQSPAFFQALVVRGATNPELLGEALRKTVYAVNKDEPLSRASGTRAGCASRSSQAHKMGPETLHPMKPSATLELLLAPCPTGFRSLAVNPSLTPGPPNSIQYP